MAKYSCFAKYPCLPKGNNGGGADATAITSRRWRHRELSMAASQALDGCSAI